jgi:phospholipid/cholesterol/gamma-HCH transport system substrate-binding protein
MSSAAKVGVFMLIVLAILGFFILRIEDISINRKGEKEIRVLFDSVAGLEEKSTVRVAGVPVGKVEKIRLSSDGRALVTLLVDQDIQLHRGANAKVANLGLLGEKYVEIDPGNPRGPSISEGGGTVTLSGTQPATIDEVTNQVSDIAKDVKAITEAFRNTLGGPAGQKRLEDIVENVHQITTEVRTLLGANEGNVNATASNLRQITADLRVEIPKIAASIDRVANSMNGTVNENREDVRQIVENLRVLSADLKVTAGNLNEITGKVRNGEGTVGKLFNSDEAHEKLVSALTSVESGVNELKTTLGRANRIGLDVGIRGEYLAGKKDDNPLGFSDTSRSGVQLRIVPNPEHNRFYNVEVNEDPRGSRKEKIIETTTLDPDTGLSSTVITRQTKIERNFVVSAQAGWQLDRLGLRLGLFDSSGGAGADYRLNDRITFTGEAFDFGKRYDDSPHLRIYGQYVIRKEKPNFPQVFVQSGVDNILNSTAFTLGGGIRWKDDDLKYLIGSAPIK